MPTSFSEYLRLHYAPPLPSVLSDLIPLHPVPLQNKKVDADGGSLFPCTKNRPLIEFTKGANKTVEKSLKVGVVFSGGQAAGGHNVISGLFDALQTKHPGSQLLGFLGGPAGLINGQWQELDRSTVDRYRNMGGFDMIGSGRTKIETESQFSSVRDVVQKLALDGLVIIGGDDSNTNAAFLAEDFCAHQLKTVVVGIPKTIDGDLKNEWIETSFGFDSACKTYANTIGSLARDSLSARKYYYFVKLMGRSASHIALECALQTQPNLTLISEEIAAKNQTLEILTNEISDLVVERANQGKDYGVILIPEGLLEFIPECKRMIQELNTALAVGMQNQEENLCDETAKHLSEESRACFLRLPKEIQQQLVMDRDPHGNVQVSKIDTEVLLISLVKQELTSRKKTGSYQGKFSPQPLFCGYEGRSCFPSHFDAKYCYALGHVAALLISFGLNGYMACVRHLSSSTANWKIGGIPLIAMMHEEVRKNKKVQVIKKALVDLEEEAFQTFLQHRETWKWEDNYLFPSPIQFFGSEELTETTTITLSLSCKKGRAFC